MRVENSSKEVLKITEFLSSRVYILLKNMRYTCKQLWYQVDCYGQSKRVSNSYTKAKLALTVLGITLQLLSRQQPVKHCGIEITLPKGPIL